MDLPLSPFLSISCPFMFVKILFGGTYTFELVLPNVFILETDVT